MGFSITIYLFGLCGTIIGYYLDDFVKQDVMRVIVFTTPLYILLLVTMSKDKVNKLAVLLGALICPTTYPFFGNFSILIAGIIGGSLALFYFHREQP
jgi:predicted branched-subunit amino acid permease